MIRKLAIALALVLALLGCAAAYAEGAAPMRPYYQFEPLGVKMYVDESWEGAARAYDVTVALRTAYDDAGVLQSGMFVLLPAEYQTGKSEYDFAGGILGVTVLAAGADSAAAVAGNDLDGYEQTALGEAEGYVFTLHLNPAPDTQLLDADSIATVEAVRASATADPASWIELSRPRTQRELNTLIGDFSTQDIFGNAVDKSVLQNAPYTLIDVWATFCSPCIDEMPELGELAREYEGRVQFMGILTDVTDEDTLELAQLIVEQTGVDYTSILPDQSLYTSLLSQIQYTPTKIVVDSDGVLVGQPIIGAVGGDAIREVLDALPMD